MLDSARLFHLLKFVIPLGIFLWSLAYLVPVKSTYGAALRRFKGERKLFVADFLEHEIDGRFDGAPIARLCGSRKWTPGLILSCEPHPGGVGEVKNAHLHCIRMAIEVGAELILPQIVRRSDSDITKLIPHGGPRRGIPLGYYFDHHHLKASLTMHCPQMKLYNSIDDLYDVPTLLVPVKVSMSSLTQDFVNGSVVAHPQELGKQFHVFVDEKSPPPQRLYPFRVHLDTPTFTFPTAFDPPDFASNFGRILRIRQDARELAGSALFNMKKLFDLDLDPRKGIMNETFVGVHLRTEKDVVDKFPSYATQAANYFNYIAYHKMRLVFLATGASDQNVSAFAERARDFNATVVMKKELLDEDDLEKLNWLSWDQRGLIDYEIMLRAGLVTGIAESSFAWNLAMRRKHAYGSLGDSRPQVVEGGSIQFQDQYSTIYGGRSPLSESMQLTIWP